LGDLLPVEDARHLGEDGQAFVVDVAPVIVGISRPKLLFQLVQVVLGRHG
jgi:hypothetical protein